VVDFGVGLQGKTAKHIGTGLTHTFLHPGNFGFNRFCWRFDEKSIVDRTADADSLLGGIAGGETHHFGSVGLHGEVAQAARICVAVDMILPAEDGVDVPGQKGEIEGGIAPYPKDGEGFFADLLIYMI
jgi:hypothetical protein